MSQEVSYHPEIAPERIASAAEFMDCNFPGWEDRININKLHMQNGDRCIAGQLGLKWEILSTQADDKNLNFCSFCANSNKPHWVHEILKRREIRVTTKEREYVHA